MSDQNGKYKWFVLAMLTLVYMFNFIDRQVMIILQEDIKAELDLSDTQLGLLTGLAFAVLYTTLGLPIARYADKHNRRNILAFSLGFWSLMTVLSGRAQNFFQLMLTRIGVSAGEAGGMPPSHSIISDYFPAKQRATALSIYSSGVYFGVLLGFILAGWLADTYGWRMAFYALGIPGILVAVILMFVIKEPIRGRLDKIESEAEKGSMMKVVKYLIGKKSFLYVSLGAGFTTFALYSSSHFLPSYLMRAHKVDLVTVSVVLGLTSGIGGILGTFIGGRIADIKGKKDMKWYLYVPMLACLISLIPSLLTYHTDNTNLALASVFPVMLISSTFFGPVYAVGQSIAKPSMRAIATALILLFMNGIGLAFGPLVAGLLSDMLAPTYGVYSLRWAISITFMALLVAALFYWMASKHFEKDLEVVES